MSPTEIAELNKLHRMDDWGYSCLACRDEWPCTTARLVDELETVREWLGSYYPKELDAYDKSVSGGEANP